MKYLIQTVGQVWKLEWKEYLRHVVITLFTAFIGIGMVYLIMNTAAEGEDYGEMGTLFAILFGVMINIFGGIFTVQADFNNAISMGKTRKSYIPAKYLVSVMGTAMIIVTIWVVNILERFLYSKSFPNVGNTELNFAVVFDNPIILIGYIIGMPAIALFLGGLYMKLGVKFFWVMWTLWMVVCLGLPRIDDAMTENPDSIPAKIGFAAIDFFKDITMTQGIIAFVVCLIVVVVGNVFIFRKQRVVV